jgi:transcriptional regulator with XRE-family HTH domain
MEPTQSESKLEPTKDRSIRIPYMPRPPTKLHVLRTIREILGLSQVALAKKIGVAPVTIKKIENHTIPMSKKTAELITDFTGVDKQQLLENSHPAEPRNYYGESFSKQWFETNWNREITKETVDYYVRYISFHIQMALDACAGVRPRDGDAVINAFVSAVTEITEKFQLGSKVRELITKFIVINADVPFTPIKENTDARARYYAELEETRALRDASPAEGASFQKACASAGFTRFR